MVRWLGILSAPDGHNLACLPLVQSPLTRSHVSHANMDRQRQVDFIIPDEVNGSAPDFDLGRRFKKQWQLTHTHSLPIAENSEPRIVPLSEVSNLCLFKIETALTAASFPSLRTGREAHTHLPRATSRRFPVPEDTP